MSLFKGCPLLNLASISTNLLRFLASPCLPISLKLLKISISLLIIIEKIVTPVSSASGVVLSSSSSHIFIVTANHFCENSISEKMMGETKIRIFIGSTSRIANIVTGSEKADLCLLEALRLKMKILKQQS